MQPSFNKLGVIGGGRMGEAMIRGLLRVNYRPDLILVSESDPSRRAFLREEYQVKTPPDNPALIKEAEVVILAVKPQAMKGVLKEIAAAVRQAKPLIISIAAGVRMEQIVKALGGYSRLARVMPNTPALVGEGVSVFYAGPGLDKGDKGMIKTILSSLGMVREIEKEELMDAITGLSGSGPAYVFLAIEALADGGVKMGLPRELALALAAQTVVGAGKMAIETDRHPGELKDMVTSPAGTTIEGINVLEQGGFRGLLIKAVEAGVKRSRELSAVKEEAAKGKGRKK